MKKGKIKNVISKNWFKKYGIKKIYNQNYT